ncbi:MAG: MATE family efflux transporter [Burkholderiaceae bacterium]
MARHTRPAAGVTAAVPPGWLGTLLRLAVPATLGSLIQSAIFFAEAGFLARGGAQALAGVAVAFPLVMLTMMLSTGAVGGAVAGSTARALGARDADGASAVLLSAVGLAVFFWALFGVLIWVFGEAFFAWAGARDVALEGAVAYARTFFAGGLLVWLFNMLGSVLRGSGDMKGPAWAIALVLLSYLAWMGLTFDVRADVVGALRADARGLLFAYLVGLSCVVWMLLRPGQAVRPRAPRRADLAVAMRVLRQGVIAGAQTVFMIAYSLMATALMATLGRPWLAGYGVAVRLELLLVPLIFGIGGSLIALVGARVGAGERAQAIALAWRGGWLTMGLLSTLGIVLSFWPMLWCGPVSSGPEVAGHCAQALGVLAPFYGWFGLGLCLYFASQGLNTLVWPVVGAMIRFVIVAAVVIGGFDAVGQAGPSLAWIAVAMTSYGVFVALALWLGPWRAPRTPERIAHE